MSLQTNQESADQTDNKTPMSSFNDFLDQFKEKLKNVFYQREDLDQMSIRRGLPPYVLREIMSLNPLATGIPKEYGGRGGNINENLALLSAASYESLPLSLMFGINWGLFLQPVAKYGQEEAKKEVFQRFLNDKTMGGLMITEPDHGSDALNMQTSFTEQANSFHLQGTKHWAGLTGWADYWLLTARKQNSDGKLMRDIDFFICDVNRPGQNVVVEEYFENLGLYMIPYGRNRIDVEIPKLQKLQPHTTGVKMMLDLLHRSRMQFPGMGMGFIKRMLDEGIKHCQERFVGGKSLFNYDQVQQRLAKLQASFTICSALCANSSKKADPANDLAPHGIEANSVKSVTADMMQEAAQSLLKLVGAKGYRLNHIAGRSSVDSRPFQIFEGSNDIMYSQISEMLLKLMKQAKNTNLFDFLKSFDLTEKAAEQLKDLTNFELNMQLPQRKLVELGRAVSRIVSMELVLNLGDKGFRNDLIGGAVHMLKHEISNFLGAFSFGNETKVVTDYEENSSWFQLA